MKETSFLKYFSRILLFLSKSTAKQLMSVLRELSKYPQNQVIKSVEIYGIHQGKKEGVLIWMWSARQSFVTWGLYDQFFWQVTQYNVISSFRAMPLHPGPTSDMNPDHWKLFHQGLKLLLHDTGFMAERKIVFFSLSINFTHMGYMQWYSHYMYILKYTFSI